MKTKITSCLTLLTFCLPVILFAQNQNLRVVCPLHEAILVPPTADMMYNVPEELSIVLMSKTDTTVKAGTNATVTNIESDDEGKYGIVLFTRINNKDYYLWYSGLRKILVKKPDTVKAGQPVGYIHPGDKIELQLFDFETPLDPANYLDCKAVPKKE